MLQSSYFLLILAKKCFQGLDKEVILWYDSPFVINLEIIGGCEYNKRGLTLVAQVLGLGNADSQHIPEQPEIYMLACHCLINLAQAGPIISRLMQKTHRYGESFVYAP